MAKYQLKELAGNGFDPRSLHYKKLKCSEDRLINFSYKPSCLDKYLQLVFFCCEDKHLNLYANSCPHRGKNCKLHKREKHLFKRESLNNFYRDLHHK